jgi:hypothetical protein
MSDDRATTGSSQEFSEEEATQILRRAAEIDAAQGVRFSGAELREIAADALIAGSAVELALQNATIEAPHSTRPRGAGTPDWRLLLKALGLLAVGGGLGTLAVSFDGRVPEKELWTVVLGPSAAFSFYRALWHRWHGSLPEFVREMVLAMGAFTLTLTALEGFHATGPGLLWSGICTAAGSIVVAIHVRVRAKEIATTEPGQPSTQDAGV